MEYENWYPKFVHICFQVILPIFVSVGLVVNVVAFCVWVFGQRSKSMCCAIYIAPNSAVDFLFLTQPLLWESAFVGWYEDIIPKTDFTCKLIAVHGKPVLFWKGNSGLKFPCFLFMHANGTGPFEFRAVPIL